MTEKSTYLTNFSRPFGRYELKLLGYAALVGSLLIFFVFCSLFRPYLVPFPTSNIRLSLDAGLRMLRISEPTDSKMLLNYKTDSKNSSQRELVLSGNSDSNSPEENMQEICKTEARTSYCDIRGDVRIHGKSGTVFVASTGEYLDFPSENFSWLIKPYARRGDAVALGRTKEWTVKVGKNENEEKSGNALPHCMKNHTVPAIIFSLGGYAGNYFHDFTDVLVPLYLTSRKFNGEVLFLVSNGASWWIRKFRELLRNLSNYDVIYIDNEDEVQCFGKVIVGLKRHPDFYKELAIGPSSTPSSSMSDFRRLIKDTYSLNRSTVTMLKRGQRRRPRILILSRMKTRVFLNIDEIAETARRVGFEVIVAEGNTGVSSFAQVVNSCDVMMGVHGAGLTNMVFLPEKAVLVQVLPIGGFEWLARTDFADPAEKMNLRYLEYKIRKEESSLMGQYQVDHEVFKDPLAVAKRGYAAWRSVYLVQQNVILDVNRFRPVFSEALKLLEQ